METQGLQGPRIALLIDFDNVVLGVDEPPGFDIELVVNALRSRGIVVLGRAYGDWYRHSRHRRKLMEQGIELVETPAFGPIIKNSADIRIALDGLEIGMTQHHINEFCLVSGDSDFLPLIKRLQYLGKTVVVISGVKFTSELVRRNCNEFISYENLVAESVGATEDATSLEGAFVLLSRTINTLHERGMEVRSSTVKQMMLQLNPVFSERNFGCSQFKQFLDKGCRAGVIKLGRRDQNSGEYTVLLPSDFDDERPEETREVKAIEPPKPAPRRTRKVQQSGEDLGLHDLDAQDETAAEKAALPEESTPAAIGNADGAARSLRRGRLRFSGKTWKGASRSVLQPAQTEDAQNEDAQSGDAQGESVAEPDASTPSLEPMGEEIIGETVPAPAIGAESGEETPAEETPTARKRSTRGGRGGRRRKTADKTEAGEGERTPAGEPSASEVAPEPIEIRPEPEAAVATDAPAETGEEKAAAKKPVRRRRAPAKKKGEPTTG